MHIPAGVLGQIGKKGMPLLFNELFWSSGVALTGAGYSLHGLSVVAGYSISSTVVNLFTIAFLSFGAAIGIIVGKQLGASEFDEAVDSCRKLSVFAVLMSLGVTLIVVLVGYRIPMLYNTTEQSKEFAMYFIRTSALFFMKKPEIMKNAGIWKLYIQFLVDRYRWSLTVLYPPKIQ